MAGSVAAATLWDPDGAGPLPACLTVGGTLQIGTGPTVGVAYWSGSAWVAIPGNFSGIVQSLLALPDGTLLAGGNFNQIDSQTNLPPIAAWNGSAWSPVGTQSALQITSVDAMVRFPSGDIVAAGVATSNGLNGQGIARWNGSAWSPLGTTGVPNGKEVQGLTFLQNGNLIAVGNFATIDGLTVNGVARWDGSAWNALSTGLNVGSFARSAAVTDTGDLIVVGNFSSAGGVTAAKVARWNGSAWSAIASTPSYTVVRGVTTLPGGKIVICGSSSSRAVSLWNGTSWSTLAGSIYGTGLSSCLTTLADGRVIYGGQFTGFDYGLPSTFLIASNLASYSNGGWSTVGTGTDGAVRVFATLSDGRLVAGGDFGAIAGVSASRIAVFDGATWSPLGSGMNASVRALAVLPDGRLVAGGSFSLAGGVTANRLAVWDGTQWSAIGTGAAAAFDEVDALLSAPDGKLYIGGSFNTFSGVAAKNIASWDGSTFGMLGTGTNRPVSSLAWHSGQLIAGGTFFMAGSTTCNRVGAWDGSGWFPLNNGIVAGVNGVAEVFCLTTLSNGTLAVGGLFDQANVSYGLGIWNGGWSNAWTTPSSAATQIYSVLELPNGDVVACGAVAAVNSVTVNNIARRDHLTGTWSALGSGLAPSNFLPVSLARYGSGFFVGGIFSTAGGLPNIALAYYTDDPTPQIGASPTPVSANDGDSIQLSSTPAPGYAGATFAWQRETAPMSGVFSPISDGPAGASPGGGTVSGASGTLPSPTINEPITLSISQVSVGDSGRYRLVVQNSCGSSASNPAQLTIANACPGDLNNDGVVDDSDFVIFAAAYNILDCADPSMPVGCSADLNSDTFVDDADFVIFAAAYNELNCP